jgi:hypothetical protein
MTNDTNTNTTTMTNANTNTTATTSTTNGNLSVTEPCPQDAVSLCSQAAYPGDDELEAMERDIMVRWKLDHPPDAMPGTAVNTKEVSVVVVVVVVVVSCIIVLVDIMDVRRYLCHHRCRHHSLS